MKMKILRLFLSFFSPKKEKRPNRAHGWSRVGYDSGRGYEYLRYGEVDSEGSAPLGYWAIAWISFENEIATCNFVIKEGTGDAGMLPVPLGRDFNPRNADHLNALGLILDDLFERKLNGTLTTNRKVLA